MKSGKREREMKMSFEVNGTKESIYITRRKDVHEMTTHRWCPRQKVMLKIGMILRIP